MSLGIVLTDLVILRMTCTCIWFQYCHSVNGSLLFDSVAESDSLDAESGFEDQEQSDREQSVVRFVSRFVDKVCTEGNVTGEELP